MSAAVGLASRTRTSLAGTRLPGGHEAARHIIVADPGTDLRDRRQRELGRRCRQLAPILPPQMLQARRIADSLLDEVRLTRRAAGMRAGDAARRVEQFSTRLSEVTVHSRDALIVVDGESGRLLFALNDAADADGPRLGREITGQLETLFDGELRDATASEIERRGCSAWTSPSPNRKDGSPRAGGFFYTAGHDVGQTELLAGAVRRWLPGEFGRRTAREHLRRAVPDLLDGHIGRARGDLQYRLAEATRALRRAVEQRYADGTDRIRSALQAAAELREASVAGAEEKNRELAEREAALCHVIGLLDHATDGGG
jgi:hypothetical protein